MTLPTDKTMELQYQIKQNAEDVQDFLRDLNSWQKEMESKDEQLRAARKSKLNLRDEPPTKRAPISLEKSDESDQPKELEDSSSSASSSSSSFSEEEIKCIKLKQQATLEKDKGNELFKKGEFFAAIECYTKGIQCDPNNPVLHANRALALLKTGQPAAAEADCNEAISMDPTYIKAYHRRGSARANLGRHDEAISDFSKILELEPNNKLAKTEIDCLRKKLAEKEQGEVSDGQVMPIQKLPHERSSKPLVRIAVQDVDECTSKATRSENISTQNKLEEDIMKTLSLMDSQPNQKAARFVTPPKSSVQFMMEWKQLKTTVDHKEYLCLIRNPARDYAAIFKHSMEPDVFSQILLALKLEWPSTSMLSQHVIGLSRVNRMAALALFATEEERASMSAVILKCRHHFNSAESALVDSIFFPA